MKHTFEKKHLLTGALIYNPCKKRRGRKAYLTLREHLLGPNHIEHMVVALKADISAILWSAQDTKKIFTWYVAKHASFQSRAVRLGKTTKLYSGLSEEAKNCYFVNGIKGATAWCFPGYHLQ